MSTPRRLLLAAALLGACAGVARADEIVLRNGDHLSGRVTHLAGDTLEIQTEYAGAIEIGWNDVSRIATDEAVDVLLTGEYVELTTRLVLAERDGYVILEHDLREQSLDRIAYINPTPDELDGVVDYTGHMNLSITQTRGNTLSDQKYGDTDLTARARHYRFAVGGKFNRVKERYEETAANWLVKGNIDWFLTKKQFLYLRTSMERDRFREAHSRHTRGGGYGVQLIEDKRTKLSLRGGLDYVAQRHIEEDAQPETLENPRYLAFGWGVQASHRFLGRNELFHEHEGFWNLDDRDQITVRSRTGFRRPLFMGINVSLQVNADWEHKVAPGRKNTDTTGVLGLGYSW